MQMKDMIDRQKRYLTVTIISSRAEQFAVVVCRCKVLYGMYRHTYVV
jgi:hypothetical protein